MAARFLDIYPFDMQQITPGSVCLVLGDRGTGKTCMSMEILHGMRKYSMGVVMAGNLDTVDEYAKHVPRTLIYDEYNAEAISRLLDAQEKRLRRCGKENLKPIFLVLDDLMYDKTRINNDKRFRKIMLNGRHYNITLVICAQYVKHISAELRPNVDYVFTTRQNNQEQRRKIRLEFDVGFPNDRIFHDTMVRCTADFACMVLNKRSLGYGGLHESVFYAKAELDREFRVGSRELWEIHRAQFNPYHYVGKHSDPNAKPEPGRVIIRKIKPRMSVDWL